MDVILLSEIEEKLNSVNTSLSNTLSTINTNVSSVKTDVSNVKTVCDNIYSKVDTEIESLLTNTNTNNTANLTGTLSQKLSYIANNLIGAVNQTGGTYNTGTVNAKLATLILNLDSTKFVAGTTFTKYNPITASTAISYVGTSLSVDGKAYAITDKINYSFKANRDGKVSLTVVGSDSSNYYYGNNYIQYAVVTTTAIVASGSVTSIVKCSLGDGSGTDTSVTNTVDFSVTKGNTYYISFLQYSGHNNTGKCSNLKISYSVTTDTSLL